MQIKCIVSFQLRYNILQIQFYVYLTGSTVVTIMSDEHSIAKVDKFPDWKFELILRNRYSFCCVWCFFSLEEFFVLS